jgi:aspartyl-tRNA(Asn)/glutamyl-tRNA(Gln) amidotransferase subunit B
MRFEAVIGLEVHSQIKTNTKLFSSSNIDYGCDPNSNVSEVDLGLPGTLPVINSRAVDLAILAGVSTNCRINKKSTFARKHYFYPDLPKGYQISQYDEPLATKGYLDITTSDAMKKTIRINRVHMEEDAGKLIHDLSNDYSMIDLNRAGVPLIEIVTEPDISSPDEAVKYLKKLRNILIFAGISDCNMEQGNFRCDVNVSVRRVGTEKLGTKTEIKNVNSFRFVQKAIEYEINRQVQLIEKGKKVIQETRLFNSKSNKTYSMRSKEDAHDYRYFPDPDLQPLILSQERIDKIINSIPESFEDKISNYLNKFQLSRDDVDILISDKILCDFFDSTLEYVDEPKVVCNWILSEIIRYIKQDNFKLKEENFAKLIRAIVTGKINNNSAKEILSKVIETNENVDTLINDLGLQQESSEAFLSQIIDNVIQDNRKEYDRILNGETKLMTFFVGQVMKETKGKGNPQIINKILKERFRID